MFAQRRSSRGLFVRLAILCCLLALTLSYSGAGVALDDAGATDVVLLRSIAPQDGSDLEMLRLNPETLADESSAATFAIDPSIMPWSVIFSPDGQTLAGMTSSQEIIVKRGLDGPVVSRIPIEGAWWPIALNADGSRLLVSVNADGRSQEWKAFDTATGAITAESAHTPMDLRFMNLQVIDPVAWKLYRLMPLEPMNPERGFPLGPAQLVATDLATGVEIATLELPHMEIGSWAEEFAGDTNYPSGHDVQPGLALSPDGSEIAVVSATDDGITLIDAKSLMVKRTMTMQPETGLVDRLFALLPFAPQTASAKVSVGVRRSVEYSADGSHLYVSGSRSEPDSTYPDIIWTGDGLSVVDVRDGTIEAHLLDHIAVGSIVESSDGSLYVTGFDYRKRQGYPYAHLVARLDGDASKVLEERIFEDNVVLILTPNAQS